MILNDNSIYFSSPFHRLSNCCMVFFSNKVKFTMIELLYTYKCILYQV